MNTERRSSKPTMREFDRLQLLDIPLPKNIPVSNPINVINISKQPLKKKRSRPRPTPERFHDFYQTTGEQLGSGSQGAVRCYQHRDTRVSFAVKEIPKTYLYERSKILKEIEIFHHCKGHPNIVQLQEYYEEDDKFYLVFNRLQGGSLFEQIHSRGHLTEFEACEIIKQIADALQFLHSKGIAHRDLKPENILCESAERVTPVRLCDFDLGSDVVKQLESPTVTPTLSTPVGSAEYMAPEVVDAWVGDAMHYNKKCDLWSLGVILYIMLSGYPPFYASCGSDCGWENGESCRACQDILFKRIQDGHFVFPDQEWFHISGSCKDLISHLLKRDPQQRFSAAQVLNHSWVRDPQPSPLPTPKILKRVNSSQLLLDQYAEVVACNRKLSALAMSELYQEAPCSSANPFFQFDEGSGSADEPHMFHLGYFSEDEEADHTDVEDIEGTTPLQILPIRPRVPSITLGAATSKLAERRALRLQSTSLSPDSPSP